MCEAAGSGTRAIDLTDAAVIGGTVTRAGRPVPAAHVRLLDATGAFEAEVVASATGSFRLFARPGDWTLRVLAPGGAGAASVTVGPGEAVETRIALDG